MPRHPRASIGGLCYHVLNRGNHQATVFHKDGDYYAFVEALSDTLQSVDVRILAYCLMPNHFHLVLWPREDRDLSRYMHRLQSAHVRRYHAHYHTSGHLWQDRFKAFPIQEDDHLYTVLRYVERNPLRALLVTRAEDWLWSSLHNGSTVRLCEWPLPRPEDWIERVNLPHTEAELAALRESGKRGTPFGGTSWVHAKAEQLGLVQTLRPRGRPRKADLS